MKSAVPITMKNGIDSFVYDEKWNQQVPVPMENETDSSIYNENETDIPHKKESTFPVPVLLFSTWIEIRCSCWFQLRHRSFLCIMLSYLFCNLSVIVPTSVLHKSESTIRLHKNV